MLQRLWPSDWNIKPKMNLTAKKLAIYAAVAVCEVLLLNIAFALLVNSVEIFSNEYLPSLVATLFIDLLLVLNTFLLYGLKASFSDLVQTKHLLRDIMLGLIWGMVIFLAMTFCGIIILMVYDKFNITMTPQQITQAITGLNGNYQFLLVLLMVVAAPLGEEFFFRGILHRTLVNYLPLFPAICLSSFGFAVFHGDWFQIPQLWLGGILLAVSYHRTQNLITSIIAHATINTIPLFLSLLL